MDWVEFLSTTLKFKGEPDIYRKNKGINIKIRAVPVQQ
jgi:hypothetical protein